MTQEAPSPAITISNRPHTLAINDVSCLLRACITCLPEPTTSSALIHQDRLHVIHHHHCHLACCVMWLAGRGRDKAHHVFGSPFGGFIRELSVLHPNLKVPLYGYPDTVAHERAASLASTAPVCLRVMLQQCPSLWSLPSLIHPLMHGCQVHVCYSRPGPSDRLGFDYESQGHVDMALLLQVPAYL